MSVTIGSAVAPAISREQIIRRHAVPKITLAASAPNNQPAKMDRLSVIAKVMTIKPSIANPIIPRGRPPRPHKCSSANVPSTAITAAVALG
jgi:hypothetical protein